MLSDTIKLVIGVVVGYSVLAVLENKGYSTHKDSTNPWTISNIQRSMLSPPDKVVSRNGDPSYMPNPSHAPIPFPGMKIP